MNLPSFALGFLCLLDIDNTVTINMAAPLTECAKRITTIYDPIFMVRGYETSNLYGKMIVQYSKNCMSQRKVYEWVERFKENQRSLYDVHSE
jgi:hypothetical protein